MSSLIWWLGFAYAATLNERRLVGAPLGAPSSLRVVLPNAAADCRRRAGFVDGVVLGAAAVVVERSIATAMGQYSTAPSQFSDDGVGRRALFRGEGEGGCARVVA